MSNGTTIDTDGAKANVTEKAIDHGVDAVCAICIAATSVTGVASTEVVFGLVSIALGKRILKG